MYAAMDPRGPKTEAEDHMVGCYPHCTFNLNPRASSIDTPLHSFIPAKHVDHMHPNSVISVAASRRSLHLTQEIFGDEVSWTPWLRPGFELGLELERMCQANPKLQGHRDGPARADQLGRRQQGMLRPHAAADRKGRAVHRAARQRREDVRRREIPDAAGGAARPGAVRNAAVAARAGLQDKALHRDRAIRCRNSSFRQQPRCAASGRTGHFVPRPLPAHQDQAACMSIGIRRRKTSPR